jgi:anti-anti-sigma regulatory factor
MRTRSALHVVPDALAPGGEAPAEAVESTATSVRTPHGTELSVHVDVGSPLPVVSVVGVLEGQGQALLAAVLDHVRERNGRPIAVDLLGVERTDGTALTPVLVADVALVATSAAVDEALVDLARCARASTGRVPRPAAPVRPRSGAR